MKLATSPLPMANPSPPHLGGGGVVVVVRDEQPSVVAMALLRNSWGGALGESDQISQTRLLVPPNNYRPPHILRNFVGRTSVKKLI